MLWSYYNSSTPLIITMIDALCHQNSLNIVNTSCNGLYVDLYGSTPLILLPDSYTLSLDVSPYITGYAEAKKTNTVDKLYNMYKEDAKKLSHRDILTYDSFCEIIGDYYANTLTPYIQGFLALSLDISPIYIQNNVDAVKNAIGLMRSKVDGSNEYSGNVANVNQFQDKCTDRFFIKLPSYPELIDENIPLSKIIPSIFSIFKPFNHPIYYGPHWLEVRNKTESERIKYMHALNESGDVSFSEEDILNYIDYPSDHILGSDDNNDLPILDNEVDYYKSLIKMIEYDLKRQFPDTWEILYTSGGLTPHMKIYIDGLLESILYVNWSCSGMFRVNATFFQDQSDDSDDSPDSEFSAEDKMEFAYHRINASGFDGVELIRGWLHSIAQGRSGNPPLGCNVFAEAIVKLSRWGERKPSCLKIDGRDNAFNLRTFMEVAPIVDFTKFQPILINDRLLSLAGIVESELIIPDRAYCQSLGFSGSLRCPVGFITVKQFTGGVNQINYISFLDVIYEYKNGNNLINGIDYNNGIFEVDEESASSMSVSLNSVATEVQSKSESVYYSTDKLINFAQETGVKIQFLCDLRVLPGLAAIPDFVTTYRDMFKFSTKEKYQQIIKDTLSDPIKIICLNISTNIVPLYSKIPSFASSSPVSQTLNFLSEEADKVGFKHSVDFYKNGNEVSVPSPQSAQSEANKVTIDLLTSFGGVVSNTEVKPISAPLPKVEQVVTTPVSPVKAEQSVQVEQPIVSAAVSEIAIEEDVGGVSSVPAYMKDIRGLFMKPDSSFSFAKLVSKADASLLGYVAFKGKILIFMDKSEVPSVPIADNVQATWEKYRKFILRMITCLVNDDTASIRHFFSSRISMDSMCKMLFDDLAKLE